MKGGLLTRSGEVSKSRISAQNVKRSRRQEAKTRSEIGGRGQPGSGNQWHSKGDNKGRGYITEEKTTHKDSFRLKLADLRLNQARAVAEGCEGVVQVQFDGDGVASRWAVVPWETWEQLIKQKKE